MQSKGGKVERSSKLNTKTVNDYPVANESFNDTYIDESSMSLAVEDFDEGPTIQQEVLQRGLDFTNHKSVLNQNLDAFMDSQLQHVAEKLAEKKSIEKYNMTLRLNMKKNMESIQEMLDDSQNLQNRIKLEMKTQSNLKEELEDTEFEIQEVKYKIEELRKRHCEAMEN